MEAMVHSGLSQDPMQLYDALIQVDGLIVSVCGAVIKKDIEIGEIAPSSQKKRIVFIPQFLLQGIPEDGTQNRFEESIVASRLHLLR